VRSSPEIFCSREPPLLTQAGAAPRRRNGLAYFGPTGVQEQGAGTSGGTAFRTLWSEGGAALWTGSWNHAEDAVPQRRVTAKRPGRVRDSDTPQRDEPGAFNVHAGIRGGLGG
jgi:hypothetical protein